MFVEGNGKFEFYNSSIHDNYAMQNPIASILMSLDASIIDHTEIYQNILIDESTMTNELDQ